MNDRLKFRMYDTNVNKMYMPNDFGGVESIYECLKQQINWDLDVDYDIKFNHLEDGRFFMQCTGLKDKNGKLIYEGDVVSDKSNHIRVVVWEQDCFKYPALKTSRYFHRPISNQLEERKIGLRGKLTFQDAIGKCDKKHFEVIGNIYENKELLEDTDNVR